MAFDKELIDELLKHADIVKIISSYLTVTKKGRNYVAVCPFHDDSNPSLTISPEKRIFKCFVCQTSGNAITFVAKYEKISFNDAVRKVAELSGFSDPRLEKQAPVKKSDPYLDGLYKCLTDLSLYYQYALGTAEGKDGLDYFENRNIDSEMRLKYRLGYAFKDGKATCQFLKSKGHSEKTIEDVGIAMVNSGTQADRNQGRVIFPICDKNGSVVGFSARRLSDNTSEAKYVNSPETKLFNKSSILYNYHIAKEKCKFDGYIYVVEGFMDIFALAKIGIDSAVATMGTALTKEHISMLRALNVEIRLCLDGDNPGQKAMMDISRELARNGLKIRIVDNQGSTKDADEILNQDGPDALKSYLNNLIERMDFVLNFYKRTMPLKTIDEKRRLVENFIPVLSNLKSNLELDSYVRKLANVTGFEFESIMTLLNNYKSSNKEDVQSVFKDFRPERKALRRLENAERELLYQMLSNPEAVEFYEKNNNELYFYENVYRKVANYISDYMTSHSEIDAAMLLNYIELNDFPDKDEISKEVTTLSIEDNHIEECNEEVLKNLLNTIISEKNRIHEKETLEENLKNKDPLDQARILADYIKRTKKNKK